MQMNPQVRMSILKVTGLIAVLGCALVLSPRSSLDRSFFAAVHAADSKPKPKYGAQTIPLSRDFQYVKKEAAADYWALSPYYLAQRDGRSCSLATFATVFNALRSVRDLSADDKLITQDAILEELNHPGWNRMFKKRGKTATLDEFGEIAQAALLKYGIDKKKVEVIHVQWTEKTPGSEVKALQSRIKNILIENEKSSSNMVILNGLQSELTGDPEGQVGHVMSVGAYDAARDRVLIMDPDREYYEPYWVTFEMFMKSMNTFDSDAQKNRGLIWIH